MSPAVSVVMPVHNVRPYLDEAIESILGQTFSDFEFVILDDASTDGSRERLREWAAREKRIRLIEAEENLGPVGSSNMVANAAKAPLVARMDADDISSPDRLGEEVALLRDHREIGLVGSLCDIIDRSGRKIRGPEAWRLSRRSVFVPFGHGTIMYRREIFDQVGGYREECEFWEDASSRRSRSFAAMGRRSSSSRIVFRRSTIAIRLRDWRMAGSWSLGLATRRPCTSRSELATENV